MDDFARLALEERKLIVGIDFGTTFSGLAWAETRRVEKIFNVAIESWPANIETQEGTSSVKVPTEVRYTPQGMEWGFQIPSTIKRHKWFKLGLAEGKVSNIDGQQKSSDDLTIDYLTVLVKHLMYTLEQKLGKAILQSIPIEFCLTVPAIWSEVAKDKTLKACEKAGLKSKAGILLVSEPEAAAIYALHGLDPHGLQIGDCFVLCDAGGGTVDLISYTITDLHPILKIKEAASGTGDLCGSTFLNRRFGDFLNAKLGKQPGWDSEILAEALEKFDSIIKKQYSPSATHQDGYHILVPGLADDKDLGIKRGRFTITRTEMHDIFEPVVEKVIRLVEGQILATNQTISAVLLVGGFGQNNYLKERLRSSIGESIIVMQPPNAWTAVVRGAVMMALARANSKLATVNLVSRVARKHYGIELATTYDSAKHDESKKYWSDAGKLFGVNVMAWLIKKGDPVEESKPIKIHYDSYFLVSDGPLTTVDIDILCDEKSAIAPVHKGKPNVLKLATLTGDLSHLEKSDLEKMITTRNDGKKYYAVKLAIEATFHSASTTYVLLFHGKRYDTVTAEYV
ncbi:hypothetical protein D0Z07_2774 [Hyphodiscus hymeniophilus]|uniref:Actin-like ATPase domain-containing protein n=1 Tax=Hyphodiscus hymeniophilus TaxID=353542 RepID=A0A9P7AYS8_9HELO|nr:hypothetical protein D0Z07_2774 [Hyphodiscus hymeniophilus]